MERDETQLCGELEALLFAAGYPVSYERLAEVMKPTSRMSEPPRRDFVTAALNRGGEYSL